MEKNPKTPVTGKTSTKTDSKQTPKGKSTQSSRPKS